MRSKHLVLLFRSSSGMESRIEDRGPLVHEDSSSPLSSLSGLSLSGALVAVARRPTSQKGCPAPWRHLQEFHQLDFAGIVSQPCTPRPTGTLHFQTQALYLNLSLIQADPLLCWSVP